MKCIVAVTERLILRQMTKSDFDHLKEIFSDKETMKYYPSTKNDEDTKEWIYWTEENYRKFDIGLWIAEDKETGEFYGQCGIVPQKIKDKVEMEIGYLFKKTVWGRGYATEAALACRDLGILHLDFPKIISLIDPRNIPSIKVAERMGMKYEKNIFRWNKHLSIYSIEGPRASELLMLQE
ncbi:GNAT family N-acetyltransferase [Metabacillus sp. RGM 3146]|uniref:GNAT family N-acetyltransferase n=1 Tax=Metabacillus sp. RGM 3146 TaxID=3401092 RepID=UPI003B991C98